MFLNHIIENQCFTESFFFACSCQKFSLNHEFELIKAAALVISLKELLSTWLTEFYSHVDHSHFLRVKLKMYVVHEKAWFLINILIKSLKTNLNVVFEKNNLEIIQWNHENQSLYYDSHYIIVLTISSSYDAHVTSCIQCEIESVIINHQEKVIRKVITQCNIVWEIIYRDEFHREKQEIAQTSILIHWINQNQSDWNLSTL